MLIIISSSSSLSIGFLPLLLLLFSKVKIIWLAGNWRDDQGLNMKMDGYGTMEQKVINRRRHKRMMKYFHYARRGVQTTKTITRKE